MNVAVPGRRDLSGGRVPLSGLYDDIAAVGPLPRGCWLHGKGSGFNAKSSLDPQRLYREQGESIKHHYTQTVDLPEVLLAKLNAMNISEVNLPDDTGFRDRRAVRLMGMRGAPSCH